ncbi:hypothetical protein H2203_004302 [Taxawa tesnikishii (nom. ined.)]|nr:hypothetical protein H2203_004302 [Dothideales sp. JES 119]
MPPPSSRSVYTSTQIQQYYDRISLPAVHRHEPGAKSASVANSTDGLAYLSALQRHNLTSIPFENLDLHYSPHHTISIDVDHLFEKIVARKGGRGGYCMENNALFGTVLRTLGFNVTSVGARINSAVGAKPGSGKREELTYSGWSHMVNIVTLSSGAKYMVDVGFGAGTHAPTGPHPRLPVLNVAPEQMVRLLHASIPDVTDPEQKFWVYEKQNTSQEEFWPQYCFTLTEFLPSDYKVMNHYTSTSKMSWFTWSVVCVKMLLAENHESIVGEITLFDGSIKRGVQALEEYLGIRLSEAEKNGIKGTVAAIKG